MTAVSSPVSSAPSGSVSTVQKIRDTVGSLIEQHFKTTLGSEQGVVDYVMALIQKESSRNPSTPAGPLISDLSSSRALDYMNSPVVQALNLTSTPFQRRNIQDGKRAHGLMQVMGWNIVKGGSAKNQKCEFEQLGRPDLTRRFLVNAGDPIREVLSGPDNIENSVLAGLLILESKWKACHTVPGGWSAGGETFPSRLYCAVGAYNGAVKATSSRAAEVRAYAASIMGGKSFLEANNGQTGTVSQVKTASAASSGPSTNGSGQKGEVVGC